MHLTHSLELPLHHVLNIPYDGEFCYHSSDGEEKRITIHSFVSDKPFDEPGSNVWVLFSIHRIRKEQHKQTQSIVRYPEYVPEKYVIYDGDYFRFCTVTRTYKNGPANIPDHFEISSVIVKKEIADGCARLIEDGQIGETA